MFSIKKSLPWIIVGVLVLVVLVTYARPVKKASADDSLSPEAQFLMKQIDEGSLKWSDEDAQATAAASARQQTQETVRGYRYSLCNGFGIIRSGKDMNVTVHDKTLCSQYISPTTAPTVAPAGNDGSFQ